MVAAIDAADATLALRSVLTAAKAFTIVHCCAEDIPFQILRDCGAGAVGFDLSLLRRDEEDGLAETAEAGLGILAGAARSTEPERGDRRSPPSPRDTAAGVIALWHRMGLPAAKLADQVVITPACGLAGASPAGARAALARCREAAMIMPELAEEGQR